MRYYLDTQIVIYAVEGLPPFQQRAQSHITALEAAGHRFVVSDLTRTECLVKPFEPGNDRLLREFFRFFHNQALQTVNLSAATHERAAMIRAVCKYPAPDPTVKPRRYIPCPALNETFPLARRTGMLSRR